ncbi:MAG: inosine monophosphate cyclohydrolase [Anaerolineae bacterium]|nr:inosine monophosphate cyclohydrolase [Anaerolineae bacterium]
MDPFEFAAQNLERHVRQNRYPGRGLVIGRSSDGAAWVQIYWIMGRSAHSQNRRFVVDGPVLRTEPVDASLVKDPRLIIYEAMLELPGVYLVSNGDQTRTVYEALQVGGTFDGALGTREREPDPPHYTPRISGMLALQPSASLALSILKANLADPEQTDRFTYRPALPPPGLGVGLTTYLGDGDPLPSFAGDPLLLPTDGSAEVLLDRYWEALNPDTRVALAVKWIAEGDGAAPARGQIVVRNRFGDA